MDFIRNLQIYFEKISKIISKNRYQLAIDGIRHIKLTKEAYYAQEIFDSQAVANLDKNAIAIKHNIYDHLIYDSNTIEKPFAQALDND
ncbi:hypothetical protein [Helicobacter sp. 11S03491-1]|uniref:hypothetical protein n=1 Tax=Helicobacter sp. 11S03491-1 TaxID=1476196 RepID=UPI000BA7AD77|nr:hypothetical protein [Helicobacter sp. 11S03491-1]PAF42928.1 hypothetical protein BKH45_02345 [Helicobacter sp. 11S03491-1]